ncbi:MAG: response regulator transcription factor [Actinomycetota bacterium]
MTIRVVVVDDQELVRDGLTLIVDAQPDMEVVGAAEDGAAAIELVVSTQVDVVLMDIRMPGVDGIAATERITDRDDAPRVVLLTTFDLDEYVFDGLRAGASGFLLKDAPRALLLDALRTVAAGESLLAPSVTTSLIEEFCRRPAGYDRAGERLDELTDREHEVLVLMATGRSNGEIAEELILGEATVKTHVGNVLMKLGVRDRVQAVIHAYETGVVVPGAPPPD